MIIAGVVSSYSAAGFSLSWVHSVEQTEWREQWRIEDKDLILSEARVKSSGAGMDPGEGARLQDGWWVWQPDLPAVPALYLAASGQTPTPWTLCLHDTDTCLTLGEQASEAVEIRACR